MWAPPRGSGGGGRWDLLRGSIKTEKVFKANRHVLAMTMDFTAPKLLSDPGVLEQTGAKGPTFEQVYVQWFHEVSRWARAFGGLDADLDDLTQEVFLVVRRKLPEFDGRNLSGWLYRIAQRTVRDYRRRAWFRGH